MEEVEFEKDEQDLRIEAILESTYIDVSDDTTETYFTYLKKTYPFLSR